MPRYVNIALPLPTPRQFTYLLPDGWTQGDVVGMRALVPFGKRTLTGVIVEQDVAPLKEAKPIAEMLDSTPAISAVLLKFTRWIADYYLASWGETLKAALPQGMSPESVLKIRAVRHVSPDEIAEMAKRAPRRAELLAELLQHKGDVSVGFLEKMLDSTNISAQLESLQELGFIHCERVVEAQISAKTRKAIALHADLIHSEKLREALDELDSSAPKQALLLSHIYLHGLHHTEPLLIADALTETNASASAVKSLVQKGYIREFETEVFRAGDDGKSESLLEKDESALTFTLEQEHVIEKIAESLKLGKFKPFLVHGVTGSGKTLVYIEAIRTAHILGKSALLLVPEISLTPQLIDRFRAVFGDSIAVFHSKMSAGERYDAWRSAKNGTVNIVIGARSAIFAPLENIGVIIVDEEHEPSYKQDAPAPRYHARDCAIVRGSLEQAVVILGSATPSLESTYNAHSGKYHFLEITQRADGAKLPQIRVVNTVLERKNRRMRGSYSQELLDAIVERVQKKEGVILFQNRRGFATRLECPDCGFTPMCPHCSVTLTYHKYRDQLRCHYCGFAQRAENSCHYCGFIGIKEIGSGTQRIEDELATLLKNMGVAAKILRMDLDTTTKKGAHRSMLRAFAQGEADILLGTQMVAKGLDFQRVSLVGVVNADIQLFMPDFRGAERTFQLLTQVAGRAGRSAENPGEVIIQTAHPKHQAILATVLGRYELFYNDELQLRNQAEYPPFSRFVLIEFSGKNEESVNTQANHFAHLLPAKHKAFTRLGPTAPSIAKLRSEYRRIIVIKDNKAVDPSGKILLDALHTALAAYHTRHSSNAVRITIDIDAPGYV